MRRKTPEDLLYGERVFFNLINDYSEGKLTNKGISYKRAVVEDVDYQGGMLESSPPNPKGSIRARIYTDGLDYSIPKSALTIFYPIFPEHAIPAVSPGEHVLVFFEDVENFSNGMWVSTIPSYRDVNYLNPHTDRVPQQTSADIFNDRPASGPTVSESLEFGGASSQQDALRRASSVSRGEVSSFFSGKKILHIGDSQVKGPYGRFLGNIVLSAGASSYHSDGRVSWGVVAWLNSRLSPGDTQQASPEDLLAQYSPDLVLITLGGNDHFLANRSDYSSKVEELYSKFSSSGALVIWISSPKAVGRSASIQPSRDIVSEKIKSVVGQNYVETRDITGAFGRTPDGLHFTARGGQEFARAVTSRIEAIF